MFESIIVIGFFLEPLGFYSILQDPCNFSKKANQFQITICS